MKIEAHHLHAIADQVAETHDLSELLFAEGALEDFAQNAKWRDDGPNGQKRTLDPLALGLGVCIGVLAGKQLVEHERDHVEPTGLPHVGPGGERQ